MGKTRRSIMHSVSYCFSYKTGFFVSNEVAVDEICTRKEDGRGGALAKRLRRELLGGSGGIPSAQENFYNLSTLRNNLVHSGHLNLANPRTQEHPGLEISSNLMTLLIPRVMF